MEINGIRNVSFGEAVQRFFQKYAVFYGSAGRSEFWWAFLFLTGVMLLLAVLSGFVPFIGLLAIGFLVPGFSLTVRRMHDVGKSGWFALLALIPLVGWFFLAQQLVMEGGNSSGSANAAAASEGKEEKIERLTREYAPDKPYSLEGKQALDCALLLIIPNYDSNNTLASAIMEFDFRSIEANIRNAITDDLFVIRNALLIHIETEDIKAPTSAVLRSVDKVLREKI